MPAKADKYTLKSPFLSKRVKLLPCQKERIKRMHEIENYGIRQLARMFKVNRRLIQFICYPEREEANKAARAKRGGSKIYYKREKHTKAMKEHRNHKKTVFKL